MASRSRNWSARNGQLITERDVEPKLGAEPIVVPHFYGSLFFASAENFGEQLPHPTDEIPPTVVILNLRGQDDLDPTTLNMLTDYADTLRERDCRFMLAEVGATARETLDRTGKLEALAPENVFAATERVGQSVLRASVEAQRWLATRR